MYNDESYEKTIYRMMDEAEDRERRDKRREREANHLTVVKTVRAYSECTRCRHSRPYTEGDENKPCPACGGGGPTAWSSPPGMMRLTNRHLKG